MYNTQTLFLILCFLSLVITIPLDFVQFPFFCSPFLYRIYVEYTNNHTHDYSTLGRHSKGIPPFYYSFISKLPLIIFMLLLMFHLDSVHKRTSKDNFLSSVEFSWIWCWGGKGRLELGNGSVENGIDNGEMGLKFLLSK